jgi:hypothetical protein
MVGCWPSTLYRRDFFVTVAGSNSSIFVLSWQVQNDFFGLEESVNQQASQKQFLLIILLAAILSANVFITALVTANKSIDYLHNPNNTRCRRHEHLIELSKLMGLGHI